MSVPREAMFHAALSQAATAVEEALESLLPRAEGPVTEAMRYATLGGGKRLRAFLAIESGNLFHVPPVQSLRAAAAVECVHAYSLIHDDLPAMDNDDLRRGRPTVHRKWDEATAILAGDALQALAFEILSAQRTHRDRACGWPDRAAGPAAACTAWSAARRWTSPPRAPASRRRWSRSPRCRR